MRLLAFTFCALLVGGCATRPKTYHAPNDAKVKAAAADLTVKVERVRETAKRAKAATQESQASAKRLIALAADVKAKLKVLREKVPAEARPLVDEVSKAAEAQVAEEEVGRQRTNEAVGWNTQLEGQVADAERARVMLQNAQDEYAGAAAALANEATNERNLRIKAEKQLFQQKVFGWLWKIGGGIVVLLIGFFVFMWLTGRIAIGAGKALS